MFRYILVPVAGTETHDAAFHTALACARMAVGHLAFLHVQLDIEKLLVSMSVGDFGGGAGIGAFVDQMQRDIAVRRKRAQQAVTAFCEREQVRLSSAVPNAVLSASFHVETGEETQILAAYARAADLTVLGRMRDDEAVTMDLLEAVLLGSGRPLLIAPAQPPEHIGRHIAIAWKDTPEAAHAVASVTPVLGAAETVTVIAASDHPHTAAADCERLRRSLLWQNPATAVRIVPATDAEAADAVLHAAAEVGADLLVTGGYSHSRMREVLFGGFTRRVLRSAGLPVLMAH